MRAMALAVSLIFVSIPTTAAGQTRDDGRITVTVAGGPTARDHGHTFSAGLGFSPISRLDFIVNVERLHLPTQVDSYPDRSYGMTRGGTMTFASAELRASLLPPERVSPFVLAGIGGGISRPNVNEFFPTPVKNDLRVIYFGAGVRVPLHRGLGLVADGRAVIGLEGYDGIIGAWPIRVGITWRF